MAKNNSGNKITKECTFLSKIFADVSKNLRNNDVIDFLKNKVQPIISREK